jgi:hypothetical protein
LASSFGLIRPRIRESDPEGGFLGRAGGVSPIGIRIERNSFGNVYLDTRHVPQEPLP